MPVVRRLLVPGLMTAVMLAATLGLGVWQVQRLHWKLGLLADIDRGEAAPPIPLPPVPAPFSKVRATGLLRRDLAAFYGVEVRQAPEGQVMGGHLLNPLERPGADPVIVDRGWVPGRTPPQEAPVAAMVEGYVRPAERPGWIGSADDPAKRQFFELDPAAIGASLGLSRVAPFTVVTLGPSVPGVYPQPASSLPRPPNNHLIYAITWFGLAAALVVVFAVYVRRTLRPATLEA